jgi:hypothetical protein
MKMGQLNINLKKVGDGSEKAEASDIESVKIDET